MKRTVIILCVILIDQCSPCPAAEVDSGSRTGNSDPLDDRYYEDPPSSIADKLDILINIGTRGLEDVKPLAQINSKLVKQGADQEWLKREAEYGREFRRDQIELNRDLVAGLKLCLGKVKDLKGNWDRALGLLAGLLMALCAWYLERKSGRKAEN